MWQTKTIDRLCGWFVLLAFLAYALTRYFIEMGSYEACAQYGDFKVGCRLAILPVVYLANIAALFFASLFMPFTFGRAYGHEPGLAIALLVLSTLAYTVVVLAANHWLWQFRSMLRGD